jgi:hypothetical protein
VAASPVKRTLMMPGVGDSQEKARRWMKNPLFVDQDIEADHVDFGYLTLHKVRRGNPTQVVPRVQVEDVFSGSRGNALIHRIEESSILFTEPVVDLIAPALQKIDRCIARASVNNNDFSIAARMGEDAFHQWYQRRGIAIDD